MGAIVRDFLRFLKEDKKWWLIPVVVLILILILFALAFETPVAPFLYPAG